LVNQRYAEVEAGEALPGVKSDRLSALMDLSKTLSSTEWVRLVRETAQEIISSPK
jgi:hypothetical protein